MGMSTHIEGIKPPDSDFRRMKAAYDACIAAGAEVPKKITDFFAGETPDEAGVVVSFYKHPAVKEYNDSHRTSSGFEVDLTKIPDDIKILRFVNSW